jgi:hypothetical protein
MRGLHDAVLGTFQLLPLLPFPVDQLFQVSSAYSCGFYVHGEGPLFDAVQYLPEAITLRDIPLGGWQGHSFQTCGPPNTLVNPDCQKGFDILRDRTYSVYLHQNFSILQQSSRQSLAIVSFTH